MVLPMKWPSNSSATAGPVAVLPELSRPSLSQELPGFETSVWGSPRGAF